MHMCECLFRFVIDGVIERIYFWEMPGQKARSVYSLFDETSAKKLRKSISRKHPPKTLALTIDEETYCALLKPVGRRIYMYLTNEQHDEKAKKTIERMMGSVIDSHQINDKDKEYEKTFYYENIQSLNNELTNSARKMEKLNRKLNRANKILNNRLVSDPLTNLVSRYQYRDEIMMKIKEHPDAYGVFCFIDIDDFKSVNDKHGHATGDEYLIEFARRLKELPLGDTIRMRIAGDEFGLFVAGVNEVHDEYFKALWEAIRSVVKEPIKVRNLSFDASISVGFAVYGQDTNDVHLLIDYADFAMYRAKQTQKNAYAVFDKELFDKHHL